MVGPTCSTKKWWQRWNYKTDVILGLLTTCLYSSKTVNNLPTKQNDFHFHFLRPNNNFCLRCQVASDCNCFFTVKQVFTVAPYTKGSRFVVLNAYTGSCEQQPVLWAAFLSLAGSLRICGMFFTGSPTRSALSTASLRWFGVAWKV